jgi:uncharacterized protein YbaR (Trm112 family)
MHILLTDILGCPRCGPEFGLILQADRMKDRLVEAGWLGCANCRERFEIAGGVADLRRAGAEVAEEGAPLPDDPERAYRCAALLGAASSPAPLVVSERAGELVGRVAGHFPEAHVIGVSLVSPVVEAPPAGMLSRVVAPPGLPLRSRSARGVALLGMAGPEMLADAARVLLPGGRLVIEPAGPDVAELLRRSGWMVHLEQDGVVVASPSTPG